MDERLATLENLARQYPNKDLQNTIRTVKEYRQKGVRDAHSGKLQAAQRELKMALQLSNAALKHAMTTIRNSLQGELDDQIQRAETLLHQHYNADADRLLKSAKELREKAKRAFENGDFSKASSLLKTEKKILENCLKILSKNSPEKMSAFQTERQNFYELKKQAETLLQGTKVPMGVSLYNQALEQARKADREFKKGNTEQATRFYQWATRLMLRAIDLLRGQNLAAAQQASDALSLAQQVLHSAQRQFEGKSTRMHGLQRKILMQAQKLVSQAHRDFDRKNYRLAMQEADVARKLLTQINRTSQEQSSDYRTVLRENMSDLEQTLRKLEQENLNEPAAKTLFKLSRHFLLLAKQDFSNGDFQKSAANLLVANKLTAQLEKILKESPEAGSISETEVINEYRDLKARFAAIETQNLNASQRVYYDLLKNLLKKIEDLIQSKQINQAYQMLRVAQTAWQKIQ